MKLVNKFNLFAKNLAILTVLAILVPTQCFAGTGFWGWLSGNSEIKGNGKVVTQNYPINNQLFNSVSLKTEGEVKVELIHNPKAYEVSIATDSNFLPYLKVYVKDKTLHIEKDSKVHFVSSAKQTIVIAYNELQALAVYGAGRIKVPALKAKDFSIEFHGAGKLTLAADVKSMRIAHYGAGTVKLTGQAKDLMAALYGAGKVRAKRFMVDEAKLSVSGVGSITANVAGVGSIKYVGKPEKLESSISGIGKIIAVKE